MSGHIIRNCNRAGKICALLLVAALCSSFVSCETKTRVEVAFGKDGLVFTLSGSGDLAQFIIYGPFPKADKHADGPIVWQLDPGKVPQVSKVAPLIYGKVPSGFRQVVPSDGPPPSLVEGNIYTATAHTYSAPTGYVNFTIKNGQAIRVADE